MLKKLTGIALSVALIAIIGSLILYKTNQASPTQTSTYSPLPHMSAVPTATPAGTNTGTTPATLSLKVPFTPQAPTGNWDELHNEACEEASAIMAEAYFSGDTRAEIPADEVETQITKLVNWEQANYGYSLDTTAAETAKMMDTVYGLHATIVKNYTEDDLKKALQNNSIVVLPVNGQIIGNPYYKQPGPIYHMLVVRGYTSTQIITNDSGTKHGENYLYDFSTLKNAGADWDHATNTIYATSLMIVVSK